MSSNTYSILDLNPLEHITGDVAISQYNYTSIMNALTQWDQSKMDNITVRLATRTGFVDYVIHTKYYYDKNYGAVASETLLQPGSFAYANRTKVSAAVGDQVTVRVNAMDIGNTTWALYKDVAVYDEIVSTPVEGSSEIYTLSTEQAYRHSYVKGLYFRDYDTTEHVIKLWRTEDEINGSEEIEDPADATPKHSSAHPVVVEVSTPNAGNRYNDDVMVCSTYNDSINGVYARNLSVEQNPSATLNKSKSGYTKLCDIYDETQTYAKGTLVYYYGEFYVALVDNPMNPPSIHYTGSDADPSDPDKNPDNWSFFPESWEAVLPVKLNNVSITSSGSLRANIDTDINGLILRNSSSDADSSESTKISIAGSVAYPGSESKQPTGVDIFSTSNYANYPASKTSKWIEGEEYSTVERLSAYRKQDYSAVMVFNAFDPDVKYKNIVNYDGPDLDQGLCIMLPVTVTDENNTTHDPRDGAMFEFLFNIWPNHAYDGREVNDLIINKAQIYVYNVPDYSTYLSDGFNANTVEPIAKFSMARLTNFYVFSENVGVPDRPVCYKARFIYSKTEGRWKTYDYYQFPDHIFLSPNGFVDPTDPKAYGVETAGFPLYQNPFSNYDLSAIHTTPNYRNQILKLDD